MHHQRDTGQVCVASDLNHKCYLDMAVTLIFQLSVFQIEDSKKGKSLMIEFHLDIIRRN